MKTSLILFAFLIVLKPVFPVIEYVADYEYISEVLCINKDKPELHCNGKCYLMKSLAEAAKEETSQKKENLLKKVDIPLLFVEDSQDEILTVTLVKQNPIILKIPSFYSFQRVTRLFHPPIA